MKNWLKRRRTEKLIRKLCLSRWAYASGASALPKAVEERRLIESRIHAIKDKAWMAGANLIDIQLLVEKLIWIPSELRWLVLMLCESLGVISVPPLLERCYYMERFPAEQKETVIERQAIVEAALETVARIPFSTEYLITCLEAMLHETDHGIGSASLKYNRTFQTKIISDPQYLRVICIGLAYVGFPAQLALLSKCFECEHRRQASLRVNAGNAVVQWRREGRWFLDAFQMVFKIRVEKHCDSYKWDSEVIGELKRLLAKGAEKPEDDQSCSLTD